MAVRASFDMQRSTIKTHVVKASSTATTNRIAFLDATTGLVRDAGAGEPGFGVFLNTYAVGAQAQVAYLSGGGVLPVKVGTGGATAGKEAVVVADGVTDAPTLGGGTVARNIVGVFRESGVAGDVVGLIPGRQSAVSA